MFTVKIVESTEGRTMEEVFSCAEYMRELNKNEGDPEKELTHKLVLLGGEGGEPTKTTIDLSDRVEDKHGVYSRDVYIMNENGKTIDRL